MAKGQNIKRWVCGSMAFFACFSVSAAAAGTEPREAGVTVGQSGGVAVKTGIRASHPGIAELHSACNVSTTNPTPPPGTSPRTTTGVPPVGVRTLVCASAAPTGSAGGSPARTGVTVGQSDGVAVETGTGALECGDKCIRSPLSNQSGALDLAASPTENSSSAFAGLDGRFPSTVAIVLGLDPTKMNYGVRLQAANQVVAVRRFMAVFLSEDVGKGTDVPDEPS